MKRHILPYLLTITLTATAFAAPSAILTRVSGSVTVMRGAQKLAGKNGLPLQNGDKVIVSGGSATVFSLGGPPQTVKSGTFTVGAGAAKAGSPGVWSTVYQGLHNGLNKGDRRIAATMRPGEIAPLSPVNTLLDTPRPTFTWRPSAGTARYRFELKGPGVSLTQDVAEPKFVFPATSPALTGPLSWQVTPLVLKDGAWVTDAGASAKISFQIATPVQILTLHTDLAALNSQLKTASAVDRSLTRAGLFHGRGFVDLALHELARIPGDPTALELQKSLWIETGQGWRLGALVENRAPTALPTGGADLKLLALRPDSPVLLATKPFVSADGAFSLQIPRRYCTYNFVTPRGASFTDFGAQLTGGPRLTIVHGPAKTFTATDTLMGHIKSMIDSINALDANKGDTFSLEAAQPSTFNGGAAFLYHWTSLLKGVAGAGNALEWTQADEKYLAIWGAPADNPRALAPLRGLLDEMKFEKQAGTPAPTMDQMRAMLSSFNAPMEKSSAAMAESNRRRGIEMFDENPSATAPQPAELDALEKVRLAAAPDTHERGLAALASSRLAGRLAISARDQGDAAAAARLFAERTTLEKEAYESERAALSADIKSGDEEIAHWSAITPAEGIALTYSVLMNNLQVLKDMRVTSLYALALTRHDTVTMEMAERLLFDVRRANLGDTLVSGEPAKARWDAQVAVASVFDELGTLAHWQADLNGGRVYYDRAMEWRLSVPEDFPNRDTLTTLRDRAVLETSLGDLRVARDCYEKALVEIERSRPFVEKQIADEKTPFVQELRRVQWQQTQWVLYNNLGVAMQHMGDFASAGVDLHKALDLIQALPETDYSRGVRNMSIASTLMNISVMLGDSGDTDGSEEYLGRAADVYRVSNDYRGLADATFNAASMSYQRGDVATTVARIEEARTLYTQLNQEGDLISCDIFAAKMARQAGQDETAAAYAQAALTRARARSGGTWIGSAARAVAWSLVDKAHGKPLTPALDQKLSSLINEAEQADARLANPDSEMDNLNLRAAIQTMRGDYEGALALDKASIARMERVRATAASSEQYANLRDNYISYYNAVRLLIRLKRPEEAFDMLSRARTKRLEDSLRLTSLKSANPDLQALLTKAASLDAKLAKTRSQLAQENSQPAPLRDTVRINNLQELIASTQQEFFDVSAQIKAKNPRFDQVLSLTPSELKKSQKSIPAGALLLQYAPLDDGLYIFAVTRTSLQIFHPDVSKDQLNTAIRAYRDAVDGDIKLLEKGEPAENIDDPNMPLRQQTAQLSKWLIDPVRKEIDASKIVAIVPSGELFYLPFHALGEADRSGQWHFLVEDKPVAYLAKGDVLSVGQDRDMEDEGKGILALGDPVGADLPAAKTEVENIAKLFPDSRSLTGAAASKTALLAGSSLDKRVLHLAAHGVLNSAQPDQSFIQLSPDGKDDGKLRVGEILGIDLNKVDLVTLSACQTALGEGQPDGTEISSLAQSFSTAGTPSVVASLWNVEDQSTSHLMATFYGALADGSSKGVSLQKAQVALLKDAKTRNPVFWAPFELLGDWR